MNLGYETIYIKDNYQKIFDKLDSFRASHNIKYNNFGSDKNDFQESIHGKSVTIATDQHSLVIIIPKHSKQYYDIVFFTENPECFATLIKNILPHLPPGKFRTSITYKARQDEVHPIANALQCIGFVTAKKHMRISPPPLQNLKEQYEELTKHITLIPTFATEEDAQQVYDLLLEEFDPCNDNIPEKEDIVQNIRNKGVVILKENSKILSMNYFTIKNSILYGWFDITRKEYRNQFLFLKISLFLFDLKKHGFNVTRSYGWRDITNKRLKKFSTLTKETPSNIFIHHLVFEIK